MTRKDLEEYTKLQNEIPSLEKRIDKLLEKEIEVVSGKVKASMKQFPYTEYRVGVLMEEPKASSERDKQVRLYEARIKKARVILYQIESFIDSIGDSRDRLIFQYRYIDGKSTQDTAEILNYTKGRISQIVSKYVKD